MKKVDPLTKAIKEKVSHDISMITAVYVACGLCPLAMSVQNIKCTLISNQPLRRR